MIQRILHAFDSDLQFKDAWQIRHIRFDYDINQPFKPYQNVLAISTSIEDSKGNPGQKGNFFLTNLRIYWYSSSDKSVNLSIGIDSIISMSIRTLPNQQQASKLKNTLIIKSQSPNQTKYQFRFSSSKDNDGQIFNKALQLQKQLINLFREAVNSKFLRNVDAKVKLINSQYIPLPKESVKSKYDNLIFVQNQKKCNVLVILTDVRLIIIQKDNIGLNYGIPWIIFASLQNTTYQNYKAIKMTVRGILKNSELYLCSKNDFKTIKIELQSFCLSYSKNPILGLDIGQSIQSRNFIQDPINQIQAPKINLRRNNKIYSLQQQTNDLTKTQFNQQLGIMMQKFPKGLKRSDLWQIIQQ